jgi:ABC-type dipeptide/oligopeptide/nickel transport system permease component
LSRRIPISLKLCGLMLLFETLIAVPVGLLCAYKKDSWLDRLITNSSLIMTAVPEFWLCVILMILFAVQLKWLPISGYEQAKHWVLPVASGVLGGVAGTIRLTKSEALDAMRQKYVVTAYAKGLPHRLVVVRHVLRNALIPIITILGPMVVGLITGSLVIEKIFSVPGIGQLLITAIQSNDYNVVVVMVFIYSALYIGVMLVVDILYGFIDPRIRLVKEANDE